MKTISRLRCSQPAFLLIGLACLAGAGLGTQALAAPDSPPSHTGAAAKDVTGIVTTPDGAPVKGARVTWLMQDQDIPQQALRTTTDASGRFQFSGESISKLKSNWNEVIVDAKGWALDWGSVPKFHRSVAITLKKPVKLSVKCVTLDEQPAKGVHLRPATLFGGPDDSVAIPASAKDSLIGATGSDGVCTFTNLPPGYRVQFVVEDEKFAQIGYPESIIAPDHLTGNLIHIVPAASIAGKATFDPTGKSAAGIRVTAMPTERRGDTAYTVTDQNGAFQLKQLRACSYTITLDLDDETAQNWTARAIEKIDVSRGEERQDVNFQLIKGALIAGRVTYAGTDTPCAGSIIDISGPAHPQSAMMSAHATTGQDGRYRIRVPAGEQSIFRFDLNDSKTQTVKVADGETATVDFQAPLVLPIQGRVVGPDGKPVAGADVIDLAATPYDQAMAGGSTITQTDEQGNFSIDRSRQTPRVNLRARLGAMATPVGIETDGSGPEVTLHLVDNGFGSVSGKVLDSDQKPLAGILVYAYGRNGQASFASKAVSNADGGYEFTELWPGVAYTLDASAEGHSGASIKNLQLRPGVVNNPSPLTLIIADSTLAGHILDPSDHPLANAMVIIPPLSISDEARTVMTDSQGQFQFDHIRRGPLAVNVIADDQVAHIDTQAGSSDLVIRTHPRAAAKSPARN